MISVRNMIIDPEGEYYTDKHFCPTSNGRVHLGLMGDGKQFAAQLTRADAKHVAYALLVAADGIDPEPRRAG